MERQPREINSLEWFTILNSEKLEGDRFAKHTILSTTPRILRLEDGREFLINDDPPTANRNRPIEELRKLHLTKAEWEDKIA